MAIYVGIKKYIEKNNIYYYVVSTNDFGGVHFYVRVDPIAKILDFFETADFEKEAVYSVDINNPIISEPKDSTINLRAVPFVFLKIYKAVKNNDFPEYLDYCA